MVGKTSRPKAARAWWSSPFDFIADGPKGLVQLALKVRGKEYLRIIYGPEYDAPENLARLRRRGLSAKRGLALREFALGHEGLSPIRRRRTSAPGPRMRVCGSGPRERAGRSAALGRFSTPLRLKGATAITSPASPGGVARGHARPPVRTQLRNSSQRNAKCPS